MARDRTDLAVIGAGPGGYAAAFLAADLKMDVTLIDPEDDPGGVCLYRGCIPSKTLLHVAGTIRETRRAASWGVRFTDPEIDLERLREHKNEVVVRLTEGLGRLSASRKIRHIRGRAAFVDARRLEIEGAGDAPATLAFDHAIVATGSRPAELPELPGGMDRVMDSTAALDLPDVPAKLLVVGGGYIGLEIGTVYAALGSAVTVVEATGGLLPGVDRDLVRPLHRELEQTFAEILLNTRVAKARERSDGLHVTLRGADGEGSVRIFDKALVAVGRVPNTGDLGLDRTRVATDERGFVVVDERRQTHDRSIFAIGDAAGEPMLAHVASHEGRVAVRVIAGEETAYDPAAVPAVVFTDPEIAWCGLTETEAERAGREVAVSRFPWAASGRAAALGRADGVTKVVLDPETGRVLGVGVAGPGAGELIAEGVVSVEMAALAGDLEACIHPHPTLSETVMEAAAGFLGRSTHVHRPRRG